MADNEVKVKIVGDSSSAVKATEEVSSATTKMSDVLGGIGKAAAVGFTALVAVAGKSIAAFAEAEQVQNKLNQSMANAGVYSKDLAASYDKQAKAIQQKTLFDDESVKAAQATIQAQIGDLKITDDLIKATADLAAAKGIDLASAAAIVGKSIGTSTNVLKRDGIEVDANADKTEKLAQVVGGLAKKYGGQAEAQAQGLGSMKQLNNAVGDLFEAIGQQLAPIIVLVTKALTNFTSAMSESKGFAEGISTAFNFVAKSASTLINVFDVVGGVIGTVLATAVETASALMDGEFKKAASIAGAGVDQIGEVISNGAKANQDRFDQIDSAAAASAKEKADREVALAKDTVAAKNENAIAEAAVEQKKNQDLAIIQQDAALKAAEFELASAEEKRKIRIEAIDALLKDEEDALVRRQLIAERGVLIDQDIAAQRKAIADQAVLEQQDRDVVAQDKQLSDEELANANEERKTALRLASINKQIQDETDLETRKGLIKERGLLVDKTIADKRKAQEKADFDAKLKTTGEIFGNLATLQQSGNKKLFEIGKAAAIANAIVNTAQGVSKALALGPPLGFVAAAAQGIAGLVQINTIRSQSFADGGLVQGGTKGVDSVPAMLMPGELVVPKNNFNDVVGSVADQRSSQLRGSDEKLGQVLDVLSKPENTIRKTDITIGTIIGNEDYIKNTIIPGIRDAVQLDNANLGVA